MKKVFALLMVAAMFSVVSCEEKKAETTSEGTDTVKVAEPAAPAAVDTMATTPMDTVKTVEPAK